MDIPFMSTKEAMALLKKRVTSQISNPELREKPIGLIGHRGVGKTEMMRQVADQVSKELGVEMDVITLCVSTMEPPEFNGLMYIDQASGVSKFARPEYLPSEGHGILFFDEWNRANVDIQNGLLSLIQDRELNGHKLGDGWTLAFAGNPMGDMPGADKYNTNTLDAALLDRVSLVFYRPDVAEVLDYLGQKYKTNKLFSFIKANPDFVDLDGANRASPRTIEFALRAVNGLNDVNHSLFKTELLVNFGVNLGASVHGWLVNEATKLVPLTVETVYSDTEATRKWFEKNGGDEVAVSQIINEVAAEQSKRLTEQMTREKHENNVFVYTMEERKAVNEFLGMLTPEQKISFIVAHKTDRDSIDFSYHIVWAYHFLFLNDTYDIVEVHDAFKINSKKILEFNDPEYDKSGMFNVIAKAVSANNVDAVDTLIKYNKVRYDQPESGDSSLKGSKDETDSE